MLWYCRKGFPSLHDFSAGSINISRIRVSSKVQPSHILRRFSEHFTAYIFIYTANIINHLVQKKDENSWKKMCKVCLANRIRNQQRRVFADYKQRATSWPITMKLNLTLQTALLDFQPSAVISISVAVENLISLSHYRLLLAVKSHKLFRLY